MGDNIKKIVVQSVNKVIERVKNEEITNDDLVEINNFESVYIGYDMLQTFNEKVIKKLKESVKKSGFNIVKLKEWCSKYLPEVKNLTRKSDMVEALLQKLQVYKEEMKYNADNDEFNASNVNEDSEEEEKEYDSDGLEEEYNFE